MTTTNKRNAVFFVFIYTTEECGTEGGLIHAEIIHKLGTNLSLSCPILILCVTLFLHLYHILHKPQEPKSGRKQAGYFGTSQPLTVETQINLYHNCNESCRGAEAWPGSPGEAPLRSTLGRTKAQLDELMQPIHELEDDSVCATTECSFSALLDGI